MAAERGALEEKGEVKDGWSSQMLVLPQTIGSLGHAADRPAADAEAAESVSCSRVMSRSKCAVNHRETKQHDVNIHVRTADHSARQVSCTVRLLRRRPKGFNAVFLVTSIHGFITHKYLVKGCSPFSGCQGVKETEIDKPGLN